LGGEEKKKNWRKLARKLPGGVLIVIALKRFPNEGTEAKRKAKKTLFKKEKMRKRQRGET